MGEMIKSSVVVCTRNRGSSVCRTIETILQNRTNAFEVLLVDQSTNDETALAIDSFRADRRFRYIRSTTIGTGHSRNIGLNESRGEIVVYTDDDCRVPENWIEIMTELFSNESIGMAFCNVLAGPHDKQAGFVPTYIVKNDFIARSIGDKWRARGIGAGMAVRRTSALSIGGFDKLLGPGSPLSFTDCEDGDMAARMLINGFWVYETGRTAVIHDGFRTWREGKELAKRNWIGVGAAYSKPIKGGIWQFIPVVLFEGIVNTLLRTLAGVLNLKKPQGFRRFIFFWYGFYQGIKVPIDRQKLLFKLVRK